ncbi:hypothetical protein SAMN04487913_10964 [Arthrobacter sp. ok362]|nr:hypothetical protein SAMN04487913_10964 [Arthrobacter sp. ok362]
MAWFESNLAVLERGSSESLAFAQTDSQENWKMSLLDDIRVGASGGQMCYWVSCVVDDYLTLAVGQQQQGTCVVVCDRDDWA